MVPGGERIPTRPSTPPPARPKNTSGGSSGSRSGGGGGSRSGGGGGSSASGAEARAIARENSAKKKAGQRFLAQAGNLEAQAKALLYALSTSYGKSRDQALTDLNNALNIQFNALKEGSKLRAAEFLTTAKETEKATSGVAEEAIGNAVRERQDSMSALLEQGAGESDALRTMLVSARNWQANQTEASRAYFDTMRSVNQGITDLNIDTKSALVSASAQSEAERDRVWQEFFNRRAESFTQLGNVRGQQRDYYAQAKEMGVSPGRGKETAARKASEKAFMDAAKEAAKTYKQKGLPDWISGYTGQSQVKAKQWASNLAAAVQFEPVEKAEGASLRRWT